MENLFVFEPQLGSEGQSSMQTIYATHPKKSLTQGEMNHMVELASWHHQKTGDAADVAFRTILIQMSFKILRLVEKRQYPDAWIGREVETAKA